jgi:type II secretion system protein N
MDFHRANSMRKAKKIIIYPLYVIIACIFFLYLLFPSDLAKDYIQFSSSQMLPGLMLKTESLALIFPLKISLKGADLYYPNTSLFFDQLNIKPAFWSLLKGRLNFFIQGEIYQGTLELNARQSPNKEKWLLNADLRNIQMDQIPFIKILANMKITGQLDGKVEYSIDVNQNQNASAKVILSECNLTTTLPVLDKMDFRFDKIESDLILNNSTLKLQQAKAIGKQIKAIATGTIELKQPIEKSILDLDVTIRPQAHAFENLNNVFTKELMALIKNNFSIKVFGTIDAPDYYLNSAIYLN